MNSTPRYHKYGDIPKQVSSYLIVMEQENNPHLVQIMSNLSEDVPHQVLIIKEKDHQALLQLSNSISQIATHAKVGMHTIVLGSEVFIWTVQKCLSELGGLIEETTMILATHGATFKQVYCVHCGHLQKTMAVEFCHCEHCNVYLMIRTHFSQRLGAYMGVFANVSQEIGVAS